MVIQKLGKPYLAFLLSSLLLFSGCADKQETISGSILAMDSIVSQEVIGTNAQQAIEQINIEVQEWDKSLSMFDSSSDVAKINAAAGSNWVNVDSELIIMLNEAVRLSNDTDGAFSVTVAPLTSLWGITTDTPQVPDSEKIEEFLPLVNDNNIRIEDNQVMLSQKNMGIDLGGIAKGAFCERAKIIYESYGIENALLNVGGTIYARGTHPDGSAFRVGYRDPEGNENSYIASFTMTDKVIAVSGIYERYYINGDQLYGHIINPNTGYPAISDIKSVGVICDNGADADAWSTALYVKGLSEALEYIKSGGTAIVLGDDNTLYVSSSLQENFSLYSESSQKYELVFI